MKKIDSTKISIHKENGQDWLFGIGTLQLFILFTYAFFWEDHQGGKLQRKLQGKVPSAQSTHSLQVLWKEMWPRSSATLQPLPVFLL